MTANTDTGRPVPALRGLDHADRVVYIGSFGKTLIPALRIGYLIVPARIVGSFRQGGLDHRPVRAADPAGDGQRLHHARLFRHPSVNACAGSMRCRQAELSPSKLCQRSLWPSG